MNGNVSIIMLSGIPGSGKSHYARELMKTFLNHGQSVMILNSDDIRFQVTGHYNNFNYESAVWNKFFEYLKKHSDFYDVIICDATNLSEFQWNNYFSRGFRNIEIHRMNTPIDLCQHRMLQRDHDRRVSRIDMEAYAFKYNHNTPTKRHGFKAIVDVEPAQEELDAFYKNRHELEHKWDHLGGLY